MNIAYVDFWNNLNPQDNWFYFLFKDIFDGKDLNFNSSPEEADIILCSTFGQERIKYKDSRALKIFYTGENFSPDLINADFALSFDFKSHSKWNWKLQKIKGNFRLPHWYLYVNWWNDPAFTKEKIFKKDLMHVWDADEVWGRPHFCSIVIGNAVPNRLEVANKIGEYSPVYAWGSVFNNPYPGPKVELLKYFKYNICFENTISKGYITEKLLEAKVAGCIPIYYGHESVAKDFNEKCLINYAEFTNAEAIKQYIQKIDTNKDLFAKLVSQPLFKKEPHLDDLYTFLKKIFKTRKLL